MKALVVVIVAIMAVIFGMAYFLGWLPWSSAPQAPPIATPPSTSQPAPAPSPSPSPSPGGTVTFAFTITDITGAGLSRTISAQIANTGTADAHNVWAEARVSSGGSSIQVGGQDYLRVDIGILQAGKTVERQVTLSFGISDGLKIAQNGATIKLTIHSDESTQAFSYDYKP